MSETEVLRDTIAGLLHNFRQSLMSLIPAADRSLLGWRAYEHPDWERLMAACFQAFVSGPISSDRSRWPGEFRLASYDIDPQDLTHSSWIAPSRSESYLAFVRLRSTESPFDSAEFVELDQSSLQVLARDIIRPVESAYVFVRRGPNAGPEICDAIEAEE